MYARKGSRRAGFNQSGDLVKKTVERASGTGPTTAVRLLRDLPYPNMTFLQQQLASQHVRYPSGEACRVPLGMLEWILHTAAVLSKQRSHAPWQGCVNCEGLEPASDISRVFLRHVYLSINVIPFRRPDGDEPPCCAAVCLVPFLMADQPPAAKRQKRAELQRQLREEGKAPMAEALVMVPTGLSSAPSPGAVHSCRIAPMVCPLAQPARCCHHWTR
jgi:hypothetical protein